MPKIDVLNEGVINGSPMEVYKAILDEVSGTTHWWMPDIEFKLRGNTPIDSEGAVFDATINPKSRMNVKFSGKITKLVEAKLIEDEVAGDFIGTGTWTFEPIDGKTKVQYRFNVKTNRLAMSLFAPFVNFSKRNSDVTQKGFKALNSYLNKK